MAMKPCRECKTEVSTEAKTCPHCGTPKPTTRKATAKDTFAGAVLLAAIVGGTVTMCSDSDAEKQAKAQAKAEADAKCAQDLSCIGEKFVITVSGFCSQRVEQQAKNVVQWTDKTLEHKFGHYQWGNQAKTVVTLAGDKVQFQNGLGAFVNMVYACDVDVKSGEVVGVRVDEGRL